MSTLNQNVALSDKWINLYFPDTSRGTVGHWSTLNCNLNYKTNEYEKQNQGKDSDLTCLYRILWLNNSPNYGQFTQSREPSNRTHERNVPSNVKSSLKYLVKGPTTMYTSKMLDTRIRESHFH